MIHNINYKYLSLEIATSNFNHLLNIPIENLYADRTGRLFEPKLKSSGFFSCCKTKRIYKMFGYNNSDHLKNVVFKTAETLSQLPNMIRHPSKLPTEIRNNQKKRDAVYNLFDAILDSLNEQASLFKQALKWANYPCFRSLAGRLSQNQVESILKRSLIGGLTKNQAKRMLNLNPRMNKNTASIILKLIDKFLTHAESVEMRKVAKESGLKINLRMDRYPYLKRPHLHFIFPAFERLIKDLSSPKNEYALDALRMIKIKNMKVPLKCTVSKKLESAEFKQAPWNRLKHPYYYAFQLRDGQIAFINSESPRKLHFWSPDGTFKELEFKIEYLCFVPLADGRFRLNDKRDRKVQIWSPDGLSLNLDSSLFEENIETLSKEGGFVTFSMKNGVNVLNSEGTFVAHLCEGTEKNKYILAKPLFFGGVAIMKEGSITVWQPSLETGKSWSKIKTLESQDPSNPWDKMKPLSDGRIVIGNNKDRYFWDPLEETLEKFGDEVADLNKDGNFVILSNELIVERSKKKKPLYLWDANGFLQVQFDDSCGPNTSIFHITEEGHILMLDNDGKQYLLEPDLKRLVRRY